ncbi:hippocampus abundant transcript 1 protein [Panulirus ornatus]|uniref:hippocampus abundant transcript 1 protein n=1 Tax=Panulirus ornatus TaxID=150431 RepID=UPI003A872784
MVAEPSHNEVNPPTSKDDLHDNQLPHRGEDLASDDADQRVAPSGRNGSSALSSSSVLHGNPSPGGSPRSTSSRNKYASPFRSTSPDGKEDSRAESPTRPVMPKQELDPAPQQMTGARPKRDHLSPYRRSSSPQDVEASEDDEDDLCSTAAGVGVVGHGEEGKGATLRRNSGGGNSIRGSGGRAGGGQSWTRGATLPDLSEFERVWEAAPEVIIKPASLASSETLTPTEAYTPSHTLESPSENQSVSTDDPSAFIKTQGKPQQDVAEDWMLPQPGEEEDLVGAVGGVGHACGCGVRVGVLDESSGRCPACPPPADVYVSEQFPSSDPLECIDGSTHTLHVDLTTGEVQLHVHMTDSEKLPGGPPTDPAKCLDDPAFRPTPTTSAEADPNPPKKAISFSSGIGEASVYHALVVIFLEFFAWGLLTSPMITVLNETFPNHTFLLNGLIVGIKGLLSFLSAPLIGALSDLWGRKFFLFITVFFTCLPIPFMKINTWWYFALISMSGVFAVTFSIVFAYVADVTDESERSSAYGLVSATFAASLVTSPALGAYLGKVHSDDLVVGLATAIAILDVFFILVAVPESLPEKLRLSSSWSAHISWEQADPFSALWKVSKDRNVLLISVSVFLSYLPEAGQYSCFFVYLRLVMDFSPEMVATFIAVVGILSVVAQTALLSLLMKKFSNKHVIMVGLVFEMLQLMWYGFGSKIWMMWAAGLLASISSITYPAISAYVSTHTDVDKQGVVQGIITGMRGLCSGLGPAVFGFIFYLFHVDLNPDLPDDGTHRPNGSASGNGTTQHITSSPNLVPGPPFVFGALLVICALMVAAFIPEGASVKSRKQSGSSLEMSYERGHKRKDSLDAASLPLMDETGVV